MLTPGEWERHIRTMSDEGLEAELSEAWEGLLDDRQVQRLVPLEREAERRACAKVAEDHKRGTGWDAHTAGVEAAGREIAMRIRKRGQGAE